MVWVVAESTPSANRYPVRASRRPDARVGQRDHRPAANRVEQPSEQNRPEKIPERERQQVPADLTCADPIEVGEDERVGEEDRIVEEGLRGHQRQADDGAAPVLAIKRVPHLAKRREPPCAELEWRVLDLGEIAAAAPVGMLDRFENRLRLLGAAMGHEPAGRFRNEGPEIKDGETEHGADQEGGAPAEIRRQHRRVEQDNGGGCAYAPRRSRSFH